jgi:pimeloyl-ACP methyl ester carboxylesterase
MIVRLIERGNSLLSSVRLRLLPATVPLLTLLGGCSTPDTHPQSPNLVLLLPGVGGDASVYAQAMDSLAAHHNTDHLRIQNWGYGWLLFLVTLNSNGLHEETERKVAEQIVQQRDRYPSSRIVLIGHSAGAGVVLGALTRLPDAMQIGPVILLAPDLSPDFDLGPALAHATAIDVFYSSHDWFWQYFGPVFASTYDHVNRPGAGLRGFTLSSLTPEQRKKVTQYAYEGNWKSLGDDGGHFDWLAPDFFAAVIEPLIEPGPPSALAGTRQSSGANPR